MKFKLEIDPITRRIGSISQMMPTLRTYKDDIIVESDVVKRIDLSNPLKFVDGVIVVDEEPTEIEELVRQEKELSEESEQAYFMNLVVEGEKSVSEARKMVKERRENLEKLRNQINTSREAHKERVRNYYLELDKEKEAVLETKYYSAVIMVIKHENRYLQEWIDWHLALGFEHIYLYDNGTEEKVTEIVSTYSAEMQGKFTVTDWSGHHEHLQQNAYEHFMDNFKEKVRWGIFIDSDEFVRFTDGVTTNVNEFLKNYEDYTEIWGYEVEYDANGQETYEDKPVRERFTRQTNAREGFYWKNFVQPNRIDGWLMHYAKYNKEKHFLFKNEECNKDLFVIDHYYTKSWEEWQWKIKERGGADPKYHKALKEFFYYNPDMKYLDQGENVVQTYE